MNKSFALWVAVVALASLAGCKTVSERELVLADQHRDLASAKLAQNEPEAAIAEYRKAIEINPRDPDTHLGLAEAYRRKGLLGDCESELREALRLDPGYHEARLALGVTHLQQERWADAAAEFQKLVDDPTFIRPARGLVNLGWAHYKSGDLDQASADFQRALKVDRTNYTAHLDLGIVLFEKGELVEAIQHFDECVKIISDRPALVYGPAEAEARFRTAQAYVRLNQREQAVAALRIAVERGGESEWARKSSDYLKVLQ
ncbi:MAG TPA: tetratricopeptide repeat protein [Myxococcota bacterium]|nr:tetratricopeptide repeat protein [Myxococcota bacterium]